MGAFFSREPGNKNQRVLVPLFGKRQNFDGSEAQSDLLSVENPITSSQTHISNHQNTENQICDFDDRPMITNPNPPKTVNEKDFTKYNATSDITPLSYRNQVSEEATEQGSCNPFNTLSKAKNRIVRIFTSNSHKEESRDTTPKPTGIEKVEEWREQTWQTVIDPFLPLISTIGIDHADRLTLSTVVHQATLPTSEYQNFYETSYIKPFLMVHQTNEQEIMRKIGSCRLNPLLKARKDVDSMAFERLDDSMLQHIRDLCEHEGYRRVSAYSRKHESLTLEEAHIVGNGGYLDTDTVRFGVAEMARMQLGNSKKINLLPVVHSHQPVVGVPFKGYFRDAIELPDCSITVLQAINRYLDKFGVQIIDLRMRCEEVLATMPSYQRDWKICTETTDAIVRSIDTLHSLRNTAKYFVVYAFYVESVPMRFYQAVVRFRPGLPINPVDWVDDGKSRLQIDEPDMTPINDPDSIWWLLDVHRCEEKIKDKKKQYEWDSKFNKLKKKYAEARKQMSE